MTPFMFDIETMQAPSVSHVEFAWVQPEHRHSKATETKKEKKTVVTNTSQKQKG